ncbi:MAG TPA: glycosyltransferase [Actinomycetes bacterium]|nr:glycosyltransferase [Actinomycetes bacterium]
MEEVRLAPRSPDDLARVVGQERFQRLISSDAEAMRSALRGRSVININSTPAGGGVAEMLQVLLPLSRGLGVDARWFVIDGDEAFFELTKRLHHMLHGSAGDGGGLSGDDARHYELVMRRNTEALSANVVPGDVVVLHDPQTAGMAEHLHAMGVAVVWRCHIGTDISNAWTKEAWTFLRTYVEPFVQGYVFTRRQYAPSWAADELVHVIRPSIDPLAPKNADMPREQVEAILSYVGIVDGARPEPVPFDRADGSPGRVERFADITRTGPPPEFDAPLVVQVSRWDPLKDMAGVMRGFVEHVLDGSDAHLVLAGPVVTAVADDPEAAAVLDDVARAWRRLPHHQRSRVQLVCLPMSDLDENAVIVNALQRHASVVVQKSLAEGFGLTVTEAMYKGTPVVASAVGGIVDQIEDGSNGLLVESPTDLAEFGSDVSRLLDEPGLAKKLGEAGRATVIDQFLPDTSLGRWQELLVPLLDKAAST